MEHNPYAGNGDVGIYTEPERTSIAAVLSLICSLICCLPAVPLLGVVLGAIALIGIGRSDGRVGGRGLAVAGIVLGILFTVAQIGIVLGGGMVAQKFITEIAVVGGDALEDMDNDRYDEVRAIFANDLATISDEDIAAFREAYRAETGGLVSTPQTFGELLNGWMAQGTLMQRYQGRNDLIPIPATFDNGSGLIILQIDQSGMTQPAPGMVLPIFDLYVVDTDGDSFELSSYMTDPINPDDAAPGDAAADPDDTEEEPEGP